MDYGLGDRVVDIQSRYLSSNPTIGVSINWESSSAFFSVENRQLCKSLQCEKGQALCMLLIAHKEGSTSISRMHLSRTIQTRLVNFPIANPEFGNTTHSRPRRVYPGWWTEGARYNPFGRTTFGKLSPSGQSRSGKPTSGQKRSVIFLWNTMGTFVSALGTSAN